MNWKTYHYTRTESGGPWFSCMDCGPMAPPEIKLERPIRPDIAERCTYIMRGHVSNGIYTSFTGLQRTQWDGVFTGDLLLPLGKSFVIAELNGQKLTLNIAEKIKVFPRARKKIVEGFLQKQKNQSAI